MQDIKQVIVEFDATVYSSVMDRSFDDSSVDYNELVPNINMWYNSSAQTEAEGAYVWNIKNATTQRKYMADGQDAMNEAAATSTTISFGDASYLPAEEGYEESFTVIPAHTSDGLGDFWYGEQALTQTTHSAKDYSVKVEKNGRAAKYYLNDVLQSEFAGNEVTGTEETGYFAINVSDTEYVVIDDILVYNYEEFGDISVSLTDTKVTVTNIGTESKPVVIVVAAYEGDKMVDAWVSTTTTIADVIDEQFSFTTAGTATKYKAFVWDTMSGLIPYCVPAQYNF